MIVHILFISSNILKINELHKLQLASFAYESSLQQNPREFQNYFSSISEIHSYATWQTSEQDFFTPRNNTTQYGLFSVRYADSFLWNSIPKDIKSTPSAHSFRKTRKKVLLAYISTLKTINYFSYQYAESLREGFQGAWFGGGQDGLLDCGLLGGDSSLMFSVGSVWTGVRVGWVVGSGRQGVSGSKRDGLCFVIWAVVLPNVPDSFCLGVGAGWFGMLGGMAVQVAEGGLFCFGLGGSFCLVGLVAWLIVGWFFRGGLVPISRIELLPSGRPWFADLSCFLAGLYLSGLIDFSLGHCVLILMILSSPPVFFVNIIDFSLFPYYFLFITDSIAASFPLGVDLCGRGEHLLVERK